MSHQITFIVYRPNSVDKGEMQVFDSLDSGLSVSCFTSFQTKEALEALTQVFLDDLELRRFAKWIKPVSVMPLINGAMMTDERMLDAHSLIMQAQISAKAKHDAI